MYHKGVTVVMMLCYVVKVSRICYVVKVSRMVGGHFLFGQKTDIVFE